ncbi:MAG: hypothetical protein LBR56_00825 [Sporomusaceae bacterium]|nr:hypothetical protein [Sporomusaceae bacterium]
MRNSLEENEKLVISQQNTTLEQFFGSTRQEVEEYFKYTKDELEKLVFLDLFSAVEAALKIDHELRVKRKKKDELSKFFRQDYQTAKGKTSFDRTILVAWKNFYPQYRYIIGKYRSFLSDRNWLAHGRSWLARSQFDVEQFYVDCQKMISMLHAET